MSAPEKSDCMVFTGGTKYHRMVNETSAEKGRSTMRCNHLRGNPPNSCEMLSERSSRTVCGQSQPHQIRPKTAVIEMMKRRKKRTAKRIRYNSFIQMTEPKKYSFSSAISNLRALCPFMTRKGRLVISKACKSPAALLNLRHKMLYLHFRSVSIKAITFRIFVLLSCCLKGGMPPSLPFAIDL